MAKNYWLKLREHFFEEDEMIFLQSQENGYKYLYLWQRLLLKCLKAEDKESCGFLRFNDKIPYRPDILAASFRMDVDTVRAGISILQNMGLLDIMDDGTYYIEHIQRHFGRDDDSAERVRRHREKKKLLESPKDKEKEIDKDIDIEGNSYSNVTFEKFWIAYDKKVGRKAAMAQWSKIKPSDYDAIMEHVPRYVRAQPDKKFRVDPERYLKHCKWTDEIIIMDEQEDAAEKIRKQWEKFDEQA
jgi:predicted phage replisome organizer